MRHFLVSPARTGKTAKAAAGFPAAASDSSTLTPDGVG